MKRRGSTALTLVHLLLVEPLPIYTFYLSFVDVFSSLATFLETWYYTGADVLSVRKDAAVGEWINCVTNDVSNACFSLDTRLHGECSRSEMNLLGFVNVGCLLICLLVAAIPVVAVLRGGDLDICRGGYMAFKWRFERSSFYKWAALLLALYTCAALAMAFYMTSTTINSRLMGALAEAFVNNQLSSVVLIVGSAAALVQAQDPHFDYGSREFRELRFNRTWKGALCEGTNAFGMRLENAALLARAGQREELEAMLADKSAVDRAMHVCASHASPSGSEAEQSCSEDSGDAMLT